MRDQKFFKYVYLYNIKIELKIYHVNHLNPENNQTANGTSY